jgi:hypothetical protein
VFHKRELKKKQPLPFLKKTVPTSKSAALAALEEGTRVEQAGLSGMKSPAGFGSNEQTIDP